MSSDRGAALMKMGERTGLENFQRLAGTLAQTLRYGTPLGQALRVLAAEMRDERMMRLEERAARLPVLLTMPLILSSCPACSLSWAARRRSRSSTPCLDEPTGGGRDASLPFQENDW